MHFNASDISGHRLQAVSGPHRSHEIRDNILSELVKTVFEQVCGLGAGLLPETDFGVECGTFPLWALTHCFPPVGQGQLYRFGDALFLCLLDITITTKTATAPRMLGKSASGQ